MSLFPSDDLLALTANGNLVNRATGRPVSNTERQRLLDEGRKLDRNRKTAEVLPNNKQSPPKPARFPQLLSDPYLKPKKSERLKKERFEVRFQKNVDGQDYTYVFAFALLPAIDSAFRTSGQPVPDATPGIKFQTEMNYQRHLVPGGPPVYQAMGIKGRYLYLVGAFIGNEVYAQKRSVERPNPAALDVTYEGKPRIPAKIQSYQWAKTFDEEVIQNGRPVEILIQALSDRTDEDITISVRGIIESMRLYCVRADRTYYAFTISSLQFNWKRKKGAGKTNDKKNEVEQEAITDLLTRYFGQMIVNTNPGESKSK